MEYQSGAGSFIAGRSVHNSRIEHFRRDVFYGVIQTFYSLFYYIIYMEHCNIFDTVDDEIDLFCLHFVFIFLVLLWRSMNLLTLLHVIIMEYVQLVTGHNYRCGLMEC